MEWMAVTNFTPTERRHMALHRGDTITDVRHLGNGWVYGHNITTGEDGAFPADFIEDNVCNQATRIFNADEENKRDQTPLQTVETQTKYQTSVSKESTQLPDACQKQFTGTNKHAWNDIAVNFGQCAKLKSFSATSQIPSRSLFNIRSENTKTANGTIMPPYIPTESYDTQRIQKASNSEQDNVFHGNVLHRSDEVSSVDPQRPIDLKNTVPAAENQIIPTPKLPERTEKLSRDKAETSRKKPQKRRKYKLHPHSFSEFKDGVTIKKVVLGLSGGFVAGTILYILLTFNFGFSYYDAIWPTLGFTLFGCIGIVVSVYVRCLLFLTLPSLCTSQGRAVFLAVIYSVLLGGPVVNILHNGNQLSNSMACLTDLIKEQASMLAEQLKDPLVNIASGMKRTLKNVRKLVDEIEKALEPIETIFEETHKTISKIKDALQTAYEACDSTLDNANKDCKAWMRRAHKSCKDALRKFGKIIGEGTKAFLDVTSSLFVGFFKLIGRRRREISFSGQRISIPLRTDAVPKSRRKRFIADTICSPLKAEGICDITKIGSIIGCSPIKFFKDVSSKAANVTQGLLDGIKKFFDFKIRTNFDVKSDTNLTKKPSEVLEQVSHELAEKTNFLKDKAKKLSQFMILTLLFLFLKSILYIKGYNSKDFYDNIYITTGFKKFDAARKAAGRKSLLPLKPQEMRSYVTTTAVWLSWSEIRNSRQGFVIVLLHMLFSIAVILFDYLVYYIVLLAQKYGMINVDIEGVSRILLVVEGDGFLAKIFRQLSHGIDVDSSFDVQFNITKCLPMASEPPISQIFIFLALYFIAFVLVFSQSYGSRLRRVIVSHYYPQREFERVYWLHEKIRHKRLTSFGFLFQKLRSNKKQQTAREQITIRSWFYYRFPRIAGFFGNCSPKKVTCLNCGVEDEGITRFNICVTANCDAEYCEECFKYMHNTCYRCKKKGKVWVK